MVNFHKIGKFPLKNVFECTKFNIKCIFSIIFTEMIRIFIDLKNNYHFCLFLSQVANYKRTMAGYKWTAKTLLVNVVLFCAPMRLKRALLFPCAVHHFVVLERVFMFQINISRIHQTMQIDNSHKQIRENYFWLFCLMKWKRNWLFSLKIISEIFSARHHTGWQCWENILWLNIMDVDRKLDVAIVNITVQGIQMVSSDKKTRNVFVSFR